MLDSGWRLTPQRRAVLDVLQAATDHPTAAEVFERVKIASPGIGPATVYRSLALLAANGLALELSLGDGSATRYDGNVSRHDHLVCTSCGSASDIQSVLPSQLLEQLTDTSGYAINRYDLQFHGLCPNCRYPTTHPQEEMNG
jgi:Fe2+ or Zn2+ uptake regulation protein